MHATPMPTLPWVYELFRMSRTIAHGQPADVHRNILSHIVEAFGARSGCLALADGEHAELTIAAGIDLPARIIGNRIRFGDGIMGSVAQTRDPLLLNGDLSNDPRFQNQLEERESQRPTSAMCWPLRIEGQVIGALSINRRLDQAPFTESDLMHGQDLVNLVTAVVEDARSQAAREKSLAESEERMRTIIENTFDAIIAMDQNGVVTTWNPHAEQVFGWPREAALGRKLADLIVPEASYDAHTQGLDRYLTTGVSKNLNKVFEITARHRDGHELPVELSIAPIRHGDTISFSAVLRDVTQRKRAQETLAQAFHIQHVISSLLRTSLEDVPLDALLQKALRLACAAPWLTRQAKGCIYLVEGRRSTLVMKAQLQFPQNWARDNQTIDFGAGLCGRVAAHRDVVFTIHSAEFPQDDCPCHGPHSHLTVPILSANRVLGVIDLCAQTTEQWNPEQETFLRTMADTLAGIIQRQTAETERREAEEQIRKNNDELKQTNRRLEDAHNQLLQSEKLAALGHLAAGVAHEINNPVGYIGSNLGTLERYLEDLFRMLGSYERLETYLEPGTDIVKDLQALKENIDVNFLRGDILDLTRESQEGVLRVKQIVQDLKEFSRVDEAEWQCADLHKGLNSTLNIVQNELKYKANVFKEYGELPEIQCVASQLNQVFMNLLVNAAQAIEGHGVITIRTNTAEDYVWVEIEDSGRGIPPKHKKRIFDPFFTTKPIGKGTGLGLSLSYGIVKKHGGRIDLDSKMGRGSRFRVWLPIRQEQARATG